MVEIDAGGMYYRLLNEKIKALARSGCKEITVRNVCGQRYIGAGFDFKDLRINLYGTPGNDLGVFINGTEILVNGNVQDGTGNTMNSGRIVVYGDAGDITGHSMRGGEIFIKGNVGYRTGIHMKEYKDMRPVMVIGGTAGEFLGEYMAGGMIIILGLNGGNLIGNYAGTGMHGGTIYIRGKTPDVIFGKEIKIFDLEEKDYKTIMPYLERFANYFDCSLEKIYETKFRKIVPVTHRPYGKIYSY
ncbi:MAG: hypothetical protein NC906_06580 [Candidatus Omnitrophica bacterium]|nr:hypothetical protein [Candidatus Omnitrophota bacterium]MCM8815896.1 hypothetical protein [Candidatus Omnitrophota bacterium]